MMLPSIKFVIIIVAVIGVIFLFTSCSTGYVRSGNDWYWVTNDEQNGRREHVINGIDQATFIVLENECFARDKDRVYFKGKIINHASPEGFTCLTKDEYGYSKDHRYVFLDNEIIPGADPVTFELLSFPYSRDKNDVYCGNIPLLLEKDEIPYFTVTNEDKSMAGMKSTSGLAYFIEFNPRYKWLDSLAVKMDNAITGEWGTAKTKSRAFKGFYEIRNGKLLK